MENLTFTIRDLEVLLGLIASIWAMYKILKEVLQPRKALEEKVAVLDRWHREDHEKLKEIEEQQQLILKTLYFLVEHEITGNGVTDFKDIKSEIERTIFR